MVSLYLLLGGVAGIASGLIGIGGGILIVPALTYFFHFTQHRAQGTTLALMIPPIGILAAWTYYKNGNVDLRAAVIICAGFIVGGWLGGKLAARLSELWLQRLFGGLLMLAGLRMLLAKTLR
ncbi:MAG: sulfite exporter TauE/SafE family protein [Elusimicrobiota bacterium]|jgi:hypothetical protein